MAEQFSKSYKYAPTKGQLEAARKVSAEKVRNAYDISRQADLARRQASFEFARQNSDQFLRRLSLENWMARAACRATPELFFPPTHFERKDEKKEREERAKAVCASCVVRSECLEYAVEHREKHGIWGGLDEAERKQAMSEGTSATG